MAVYTVDQGKVNPARPQEFRSEVALRRLTDDNLEDITGVRLIPNPLLTVSEFLKEYLHWCKMITIGGFSLHLTASIG